MSQPEWTESRLQQMIQDGVEESLILDYKAADALDQKKKTEIGKDVSAMANSAGGTIIYGIFGQGHIPSYIDPIKRSSFSKERLEQIISSNIHPRIDGIVIHPVTIGAIGSDDVVYVVEIPQSYTAHQSKSHKYYKRFNFESAPMEDYEIRDVMSRGQSPRLEIEFLIRRIRFLGMHLFTQLTIRVHNKGSISAEHVQSTFYLPELLAKHAPTWKTPAKMKEINGLPHLIWQNDNSQTNVLPFFDISLGNTRRIPILPGQNTEWHWNLPNRLDTSSADGSIHWELYSEQMEPRSESMPVEQIQIETHYRPFSLLFALFFQDFRTGGVPRMVAPALASVGVFIFLTLLLACSMVTAVTLLSYIASLAG